MRGITLIEILLVLAIIISILIFGLQRYQLYRQEMAAWDVKQNVDKFLFALYGYYRANCGVGGQLHPDNTPIDQPKMINIQDELANKGFIDLNSITSNILVNDETDSSQQQQNSLGYKGYYVQFNGTASDKKVCITAGCRDTATIGTNIIWKMQVAVHIINKESAESLKNILEAQCVSSQTGDGITPCSKAPPSGEYIVFERSPSMQVEDMRSEYWMINPNLQRFKNMYDTYPIDYLVGSNGMTPRGRQYYVCGE